MKNTDFLFRNLTKIVVNKVIHTVLCGDVKSMKEIPCLLICDTGKLTL